MLNDRLAVGLLLLGSAPERRVDDIDDLRLRTIARIVVCAQASRREMTDEFLTRCMRVMGHEAVDGELEELRREASLHDRGGLG